MANQKSKLPGTIGFLLILAIGFGFGLVLISQSRSTTDSVAHADHGIVAEESMPGMDMSAGEPMPGMDLSAGEMASTTPDDSPVPLLVVFIIINLAIIFAALILKKVRSKRKAEAHRALPILKFEGGSK